MNSVDGHRRLVSCVESGGAGLQFNSVVGTKLTGRIRSGLDTWSMTVCYKTHGHWPWVKTRSKNIWPYRYKQSRSHEVTRSCVSSFLLAERDAWLGRVIK